ncbi:16510_t:CDS:2, partial [Dentiscutata heterogama]
KCDTFKCGGCANTILIEGNHILRITREHNHAAKTTEQTLSPPSQIIQSVIANNPSDIYPYVSSYDSLYNLIIPDNLKTTLDGTPFLVKDSTVGDQRILLFTTVSNIQYLSQSLIWLMDRTFDVPTIFQQLYTIHGFVRGDDNSRVLPLVYALMSKPEFVLTDFELAATNAFQAEFISTQSKGCFFHLSQNVYRKVRDARLATQYGTNESFSIKICQIPALAFLSSSEIPGAFNELKGQIPEEADSIVKWFEKIYICRQSVYENNEYDFPRTNNSVETWHRRWETLIGSSNLNIFRFIKEIQKEQNRVQLDITAILQGAPRPTQERLNNACELRIRTVLDDHSSRPLITFLEGIAHNLSL